MKSKRKIILVLISSIILVFIIAVLIKPMPVNPEGEFFSQRPDVTFDQIIEIITSDDNSAMIFYRNENNEIVEYSLYREGSLWYSGQERISGLDMVIEGENTTWDQNFKYNYDSKPQK